MTGLAGRGVGEAAGARQRPEPLGGLLKAARVGPDGHPAAVRRVLVWLGRAVGGSARIADDGGHPNGHPKGPAPGTPDTALLRAVAAGSPRAAVVAEPGRYLRVLALGGERPHPVLVVTRPSPYDETAASLVAHAATVLELLLGAGDAEAQRRRLAEAGSGVRLSVLQLLMGGEVALAQRTMAGLRPGLLDAERAVVLVLESPAAERREVARACEGLLAGRALVVRCPADDGHVIIVAPTPPAPFTPSTPAGTPGTAEGGADGGVEAALREFVAGRDGVFLGVSDRHPLSRVAAGYDDAVRSLAAARLMPGRVAGHRSGVRLAEVVDAGAAAAWAAGFLRPLGAVPAQDRGQLTATVRLGLEFTAVNAARLLGISRNTVRARMDRAAGLLGVDLGDVRDRAALDLALRFLDEAPGTGRYEGRYEGRNGGGEDGGEDCRDGGGEDGRDGGRAAGGDGALADVGLWRLLDAVPVRAWARGLLAPLRTDERDLLRTLRDWVGENCAVEPAARRRGVHPQTVREHLRGAEGLLRRQLVAGGSGLHEVVFALTAAARAGEPDAGPCGVPDEGRNEAPGRGLDQGPHEGRRGDPYEAPCGATSGWSARVDRAPVTPSCPATVHP
ncbi:helix-turn-helix domain-containing protein [Streptomyces sp. NPDC127069]|uniref:helix-turn-helix domain-containing protein n=1 Tax=Streptomyces sp. NPDC127069 TaxID=3347128 RepID=UPI0036650751